MFFTSLYPYGRAPFLSDVLSSQLNVKPFFHCFENGTKQAILRHGKVSPKSDFEAIFVARNLNFRTGNTKTEVICFCMF